MATGRVKKVGFGAAKNITLSSTNIAAQEDGILVVYADPDGSTVAMYYVQDYTTSQTFAATSTAGPGTPATAIIPWVGGHYYRNTYSNHVGTVVIKLYPFV